MNRRKVATRATVTLVALALAVSQVDLPSVDSALRTVRWHWFAAAGALNVVGVLLSAKLWQTFAVANGYAIRYRSLVIYYYITQFFSTFLPSTVGGDAARAHYVRKDHGEFETDVSSIVAERLTGLATLGVIATVGIWALPGPVIGVPNYLVWSGFATVMGAALFVYFTPWLYDRCRTLARAVPAVGDKLDTLLGQVGAYRTKPTVLGRAVVWSLLFRLSSVGVIVVIGTAVGVPVALPYYVAIMPVIELLIALPISINGWGVREAAFVGLFGLVGVTPANALLLALGMYGSNIVFNSGTGGLVYMLYKSGWLSTHAEAVT